MTPLCSIAALVEPLDGLGERRLREREGEMVHAARIRRRARRVARALLVREDGDQAPIARIEVQVALGGVVEVRLLEDERHPQHALPEVDRRLSIGADQRDVVQALALQLSHRLNVNAAIGPSADAWPQSRSTERSAEASDAFVCGPLRAIAMRPSPLRTKVVGSTVMP